MGACIWVPGKSDSVEEFCSFRNRDEKEHREKAARAMDLCLAECVPSSRSTHLPSAPTFRSYLPLTFLLVSLFHPLISPLRVYPQIQHPLSAQHPLSSGPRLSESQSLFEFHFLLAFYLMALKQNLSLDLLVRMSGQEAPRICLFLDPQHWASTSRTRGRATGNR